MKKAALSFIALLILSVIFFCGCSFTEEELISTSKSPNGKFTVETYLVNGGATVDYSVKAYIVKENKKTLIYNEYHQSEADINWVNDYTISINGIELDLANNDTYDWRSGSPNKEL